MATNYDMHLANTNIADFMSTGARRARSATQTYNKPHRCASGVPRPRRGTVNAAVYGVLESSSSNACGVVHAMRDGNIAARPRHPTAMAQRPGVCVCVRGRGKAGEKGDEGGEGGEMARTGEKWGMRDARGKWGREERGGGDGREEGV